MVKTVLFKRLILRSLNGHDPGLTSAFDIRTPDFLTLSGTAVTLRYRVDRFTLNCAAMSCTGTSFERSEPGSLLFPAAARKTGKLSSRPLARTDAADMLKRRLKQAGLPAHYSPHSFRATGITNFLENDGTLEAAQRIAGHADSGQQSFTIVAVRRSCSRIWSGFGIKF
jgi:hypothetical protein